MSQNKDKSALTSVEDDARIQDLLEQYHQIAHELHSSSSRAQANQALAPINELPETTQMALLKALSREHNTDAADLLLAIYELSPFKAIHKEARRSLIRLEGARIHSSWTPVEEQAPIVTTHAPRFWKGVVTQKREQGEVELVLTWEQGFDYSEARMFAFRLDFWEEGINNFFMEEGSKRRIEARAPGLKTLFNKEDQDDEVKIADCTLAEGRRLLEDALSVNRWRGTKPHEEYRHHLPTLQQLIFNAADVGEDRGRTFINPDQEPDEIVGDFIGGWSMGDYGLCYDLLTRDSAIRNGLERNEWIELRRKWADEAHPALLQLNFIRELEHNQQSIWLPNSVISSRANTRREVEAGWSLELTDTPLSGTLAEMPMGTVVNKETGRHWFWTSYILVQEDGEWRIQRVTDEGASAQGLSISELQSRLKEHDEHMQELLKKNNPNSPESRDALDEIIWRMAEAMHYDDALLTKLPLDRTIYEDAYSRAMGIGVFERAVVYLERLAERFTGGRGATLQQLGSAQAALGDIFAQRKMDKRSEQFFELGEAALREALTLDDTSIGHIILAELLTHKGELEDAETHLQQAKALHPNAAEQVQIESDLGNIAMEREQYDEALRHLERVAELEPNHPGIWYHMGFAYQRQQNAVDAESSYLRAIEMQPNDIRAYGELTSLYMNTNRASMAQELLERGIRTNPNSAHLRAILASVFMEKGDQRRAQAILEEAERINPDLEVVQLMRQAMDANKAKKK